MDDSTTLPPQSAASSGTMEKPAGNKDPPTSVRAMGRVHVLHPSSATEKFVGTKSGKHGGNRTSPSVCSSRKSRFRGITRGSLC